MSPEFERLWGDIKKSSDHIYNANSEHFTGLTSLFLTPIPGSLIIYSCIHLALFHPDFFTSTRLFFSNFEIRVLLVYALFLVLFFICVVATVTYSAVNQAYHNISINFVSSIKSIRKSFFPLLSTLIVSHTIFISITLVFALVLLLLTQILQTLGLIELKFDSNHLLFLVIFALIVVSPVLLGLQLHWSLAYVIAVAELKWGFEALRRSSAYLVKEKRWVAFRLLLHGLLIGVVIGTTVFLVFMAATTGGLWMWVRACIIPIILLCSLIGSFEMSSELLMLNVVLYMYCKDFNGEKLPLEIGDKFADEVVYMPLDDDNNHAIV